MLLEGATIETSGRHSPFSTAQTNRLYLALLASLLAHVAVALLPSGASRPELRAALTVRVLPPPAPPAAAAAPRPERAIPPLAPPWPAQPRQPESPSSPVSAPAFGARSAPVAPIELAAPHSGLISVQTAYGEFGIDQQEERLDDVQRRVPRSNSLPRPAQPLEPIRPAYPQEDLEKRRRGHVLLEAFVDANGKVDTVIVVDHNGQPNLGDAAAEAVLRAAFRPAEGPDGKTRSRVTLRVDFRSE